jgi:hypothetical protein
MKKFDTVSSRLTKRSSPVPIFVLSLKLTMISDVKKVKGTGGKKKAKIEKKKATNC